MAELLLVANPKRRRRRKMSALQRKFFGGGKRRRKARAAHHRRRRSAAPVAVAPRRRRRRHAHVARRRHTVRANPHRRHHYRRRSNPFSVKGFTGQIMPTVKAGAVGAAGALGLDALWGLVSGNATLSPYLSNQYVGLLAKAVGAVAIGTLGGHLLKGKGRDLAVGAMTVTTHDFLKALLESSMPTIFGAGGSLPLGSYLSGSAPIVGTATVPQAYLPFSGVGSYLSGPGGQQDSAGVYTDDIIGMDPWGGNNEDGRIAYS
jgi:hypothetical protein